MENIHEYYNSLLSASKALDKISEIQLLNREEQTQRNHIKTYSQQDPSLYLDFSLDILSSLIDIQKKKKEILSAYQEELQTSFISLLRYILSFDVISNDNAKTRVYNQIKIIQSLVKLQPPKEKIIIQDKLFSKSTEKILSMSASGQDVSELMQNFESIKEYCIFEENVG